MDGSARRRELADFLRTRRAALTPQDVGLPAGGRRRTPGLRREEVAQLAGVGTTWYTWLEQARDVRASRTVLEAVGAALRLTPAEHRHLLRLGRGEEVELPRSQREAVSPTLQRLIENLGDANPAYLLGRRWDYLAWNPAAAAVFGDPGARPVAERNHVWALFTDPLRCALVTDYDETTRAVVARFRGDAARHVGDPTFEQLIDDLKAVSPLFRRLWKRHEVAGDLIGRKVLRHPEAGELVFEHAALRPAEAPDQRLILYSPLPEQDTARKMMELMASVDDAAVDALYAGELEDFVGARDALAKALRGDGDRAGAAAVKKLAKPTRAAWAVNRLVRDRPEEIGALVAAGEALAGAQEQLLDGADPDVLRGAAEAARRLVDALAAESAVEGAAKDKVRATLHAATVDADVRVEVAAGRVLKERSASGFGGLEALIAAGRGADAKPARGKRKGAKGKAKGRAVPSAPPPAPSGPDPREVRRRRDTLRRALEAEADAESAVDGARRALEQVEATLAARRLDLEEAERALSHTHDRRARAEAAAAELDAAS